MNICVGEEWGASCDNREHQQEEHINAGMGENAMEQKTSINDHCDVDQTQNQYSARREYSIHPV